MGTSGGDEGCDEGEVGWVWREVVAAAWRKVETMSDVFVVGQGKEGVPWNQRTTFWAEGLPIQYALVPSANVTFLGSNPSFFANAGYISSKLGKRDLVFSVSETIRPGALVWRGSHCECLTVVLFTIVRKIASRT